MKKIVFLIDNFKGGGSEKAINLISHELHKRGQSVDVVLLENQLDYPVSHGLKVHHLTNKITKYNFIALTFRLIKLLQSIKPDIIYATNTKAQVLSLLTKNSIKATRVTNIQVDLTKQYEKRWYLLSMFTQILKKTDIFSFISHGIYQNQKDKIKSKNNIFIPNPINKDEINEQKSIKLPQKYEHIFSKKVIINIGRLCEQKGQDLLLKSFANIKDDYNLVILGIGADEQKLKNQAQELNIYHKVFFIGFVENPFMFLSRSSIFVLSSNWEGFGNVLIEAMQCHIPIISTNCPSGPNEILCDEDELLNLDFDNNNEFKKCKYGLLVKHKSQVGLTNAINYISSDKTHYTHYKNQAIKRADDFDIKIICDKFEKSFLD